MSRNRKNQSAAIRLAPAMKAALLCAFIGGSAIGYVWQKNQIIELGRTIKAREGQLGQLRAANLQLSKQVMTLRSPSYIERRIRELNLPLALPAQAQILRLVEMPVGEPRPRNDLLAAGRNTGPVPSRK
jgi:cell division protein FtsB